MHLLFSEYKYSLQELRLIDICLQAHATAAYNNNISSNAVMNVYRGSGQVSAAIATGILSIGDVHGPITKTRGILEYFSLLSGDARYSFIQHVITSMNKVPGLGNSFFKDRIDPAFLPIYSYLAEIDSIWIKHIDDYVKEFNKALGKSLYPNAALLTSAVSLHLKLVPGLENWFFIAGRSFSWLSMIAVNKS